MKNKYTKKSLLSLLTFLISTVYFGQTTYSYTGGPQSYIVPIGIASISVECWGAQGGGNVAVADGGLGGYVSADITVTPGQTINVYVGGQGTLGGPGGYNGGGSGIGNTSNYGGSGGGASDIRIGGITLNDRIVVAGGGAGGMNNADPGVGGAGGGLIGADGIIAFNGWNCTNMIAATGGTQSAGGQAGTSSSCGWNGTNGSFGMGGNSYSNYACSGGGGGWYGGGGAQNGGSGAGGSSYTVPTATNITHIQGDNLGNGQVIITELCNNTGTDTQTACNSYTWIDGNTYTSSNTTATHTISNVSGCDSVVTLNLTINNSNTGTDTQTACNSYTWIDGNTYTSSNTTATYILTNSAGCDSVVTLNLTINTITSLITNFSPTLMSNISQFTGASYQWLDCNNNYAIIPGAISPSFTATSNGNYAVVVSLNNCIDTSVCESVNNVSIVDFENNNVSLFPNPTNDLITIDINGYNGSFNVEIYDLQGRLLETTKLRTVSLKKYSKGIYIFRVSYGDITEDKRVLRK